MLISSDVGCRLVERVMKRPGIVADVKSSHEKGLDLKREGRNALLHLHCLDSSPILAAILVGDELKGGRGRKQGQPRRLPEVGEGAGRQDANQPSR